MTRSLLTALLALPLSAFAQISYTGGAYSQNFDTLQGTTNNTTGVAWTDNVTLPGWYSSHTTYGVTNGTMGGTAATFDGTSVAANVGLFSFGTSASTDRALGSRSTSGVAGMTNIHYGVRLVNNTAQTITSFSVMFTGEQWHKNGATTAHTLPLQYRLGATGIADAGAWTSVATFSSPVNTTTIASLDGNAAANRRGVAGKVTGVSWAPGAELWVRVADGNESGNEQAMGIDDFHFVAEDESGLFLNGNTSYVSMGFGATVASLNTSSFTVECRFMRTGPGVTASTGTGGVTTAIPLVAKGVGEADNDPRDADYFLGIDNVTGKLCADFEQKNATVDPNGSIARAAGQNFPVYGSTVLQNGVFYHVAATYDTATAVWKLYVNGVEETTTQTLPTFVGVVPNDANTQGLGIGTTVNSTGARAGFFHGVIDEARIWNYARTASDILANKDVEITSATGLLARYGFDEAAGTTAAGTNAVGGAAPVGTLAGTVLPVWVNAKVLVPNIAPTVSITAPATGSSVMFPAAINFSADAADTDGSITKVEFFNGATKIGEDLTGPSPFTFSWTGAPVGGPYSITAVATDNGGATATSAAVTVTVTPNSNQAPVVTVTSPADNATGIGSSTTLNLSIADNEGDAQTVNFFGRVTTPSAPGADFSLIAIPDTQYYSENTGRNASTTGNPAIDIGAKAAIYNSQMDWIVNNRTARNIAFVSHMGDIAQNGDAFESEWIVASTAQSLIENPATTLVAHGIPWGCAPGNHDQMPVGDAGGVTNFYTKYFHFTRWDNRPYYGGHFGTKPIVSGGPQFEANTNNYELFSASGMDFIVIHMEYDARAKSFYQGVLDWADALLKAYPTRRAIITSHWIVNTGNPATFSTQGQNIYDDLKDNPNLFLMLCGHVHGEGRRSDVYQGRTVHSILSDYQETKNGGNGFLRALTFKPSTNTIHVESHSPWVNRAVDASDAIPSWTTAYDLNYNMQSAVTDWIPLGSVNVPAAGMTASLNWTGLEAGKDYEWYATVNDSINTVTTATRRFSTTANVPPTVAITAPADNASMTAPASFTITADAADTDGSIARVEFYQGGTKLGEDTSTPFEQSVSGLLTGSYVFAAIAVDNSNATALSSVVDVTVNASLPPTVAITSPLNNASFDAPATITIEADASDTDGTVTLVEFFNGATKIGEDSGAPYSVSWTPVFTGSYSLTAKATDNALTTTTSTAVNVTVTNIDNVAPSVAITSPSNNASVAPAVPLTLNATASDTDGTVSKVEFFDGATLLGEDTTAPFSFTVASLAAGAHTFTAKATDNDSGTTTSSVINVTGDPALWAYAQNFDSMASGTAPPSGWSFYGVFGGANTTYENSTPIPASAAGGGTLNNTLTAATTFTASSNTAGYNYALPASPTDRALGTSPTSGQFVALQLSLTNPTGAAITAIRVGYDIRRFTSVATENHLPGYFPFYSLDNGVTWNAMPTLNTDITSVPNTVGVTNMGPATISLASPWADGATLLIRWLDDNAVATSPDQIIGLDNVSITRPVGQPPTVALIAPANGSVSYVGDTINFTANATDTDGTITKVEFYNGASKLGEDASDPYEYAWTGFTTGTYSLTARATDNDGNITSSTAASVTVNAAPGSGTLTRSPYLNMPNHNSIVVRWRTSQAVVGRVRYGTSSSALTQITDEATARTDHEVRLAGLASYTRYYYSIGSAFDTLTPEAVDTTTVRSGTYTFAAPTADDYTFRTAPVPGTATDTRIWIVGDCGRGSATQAAGRDAYYNWMGSRVPDLNLQLGDNAYNSGTDAEYQSGYYLMYPTIFRKMPQWSTLGNHDANNGNTTPTANWPYFDMFTFPTAGECGGVASGTEHYYSFDYGNIHFICLDSQTTLANNSPSAPQTVWLQNDLASTTKTWIIAFFHHPPYSKGSHDSDTEGQMVTMRQIYNPILEAGGVDLVLTGHSHNYERSVLLDGNYGTTGTITAAMKKNSGNGSLTGFTTSASGVIRNAANGFTATATVNGTVIAPEGAYKKPLTGPRDHFGAVYNTAGMSGQADGGALNHSAMYISYNQVGTVNLDINGNTLTATFIQSGGAAPDNYTIIKQGAADTDGDGVSDEFEIANGMNRNSPADATLDTDYDGLDAVAEYLYHLNPGSSDRYAWVTTRNPATQNMEVAFPTQPQRSYQVFYSHNLLNWFPASAVVPGDGGSKVWIDDGAVTGTAPSASVKRFYKVEVLSGP